MHISLQLFVFYGISILKSCVFHAHQFATAHVLILKSYVYHAHQLATASVLLHFDVGKL